MDGPLRVTGYTELVAALRLLPRAAAAGLRDELRKGADSVREDATERFDSLSAKTAAGFRTYVRASGISVEQSLRKTTGLRPDWGGKQMTDGLLPALKEKEEELAAGVDAMVAAVAEAAGL